MAPGDVGGQALALGLVDEVAMDVVPVVFGSGKRYFGPVAGQHLLGDANPVIQGDRVLHLRYRVKSHDWFKHGTSPKDNPWVVPAVAGDDWPDPNVVVLRTPPDPTTPPGSALPPTYDFPACVGVFGRPQYQLVADGELYHVNFALARWEWIAIRQYTDSLLAATGVPQKVTAAHY